MTMSSRKLGIIYWFMVIGTVLFPTTVFLFYGYQAAGAVTPTTQIQVVAVMTGFLTVDGLLLGLGPRFREPFGAGDKQHRAANFFEALQIGVPTISLMWSLVAMLYAAFSTDISLVSSWFKGALTAFFLTVSIYSGLAIMTRRGRVP
jgi:hypothetical protein